MEHGKVTSRKFTSKGLLVEVSHNGKTVRQLFSTDQINLMNLVGTKVPVVGQEVSFEFSANPTSGLVSEEWISINL